jgi:hypothetical protein
MLDQLIMTYTFELATIFGSEDSQTYVRNMNGHTYLNQLIQALCGLIM